MTVEPEPFDLHMSDTDALMWNIEKDPLLRSTIVTVNRLDRDPDWDRLVERIDYGSQLIPRLRQRVVTPIMRVGPPHWSADPDFDLSYHLRRVRAPSRDLRHRARPRPHRGDGRVRPGPAAVGVHAGRGARGRRRGRDHEGPPLDHRRRRRHEAGNDAVRHRARARARGPRRRAPRCSRSSRRSRSCRARSTTAAGAPSACCSAASVRRSPPRARSCAARAPRSTTSRSSAAPSPGCWRPPPLPRSPIMHGRSLSRRPRHVLESRSTT